MPFEYSQDSAIETEIVIGLIGPIGCDRNTVSERLKALLGRYHYITHVIKVSDIIKEIHRKNPGHQSGSDEYSRVSNLMNAGNEIRKCDSRILAMLAASRIRDIRKNIPGTKKNAYIVDSIKHPDEISELRNIYSSGFYLIAINATEERRKRFLADEYGIKASNEIEELIKRDSGESSDHGQHTSDAFHMADFFLAQNGNNDKLNNSLERFIRLIFAHPFTTPTFQEYAMFMAYASSIRSADMSRQVGAVVTRGTDILSSGANECPKAGGGTYWPLYDDIDSKIYDTPDGRDYMFLGDHNAKEKKRIKWILFKKLSKAAQKQLEQNIKISGLDDLTEFGRVVHAEMDALLSCARLSISCQNAVLICTTFPCHNCAKHIIASGIKQVIYIEPYPKSKALEMHGDSVTTDEAEWKRSDTKSKKVLFNPFVGVGPRQFINLFSLSLSTGARISRKKSGTWEKQDWAESTALPRLKMLPTSYIQNEVFAGKTAVNLLKSRAEKIINSKSKIIGSIEDIDLRNEITPSDLNRQLSSSTASAKRGSKRAKRQNKSENTEPSLFPSSSVTNFAKGKE